MNVLVYTRSFALAALSLGLTSCVDTGARPAQTVDGGVGSQRPNVLVLMFDDLRFDTFSYRGGPVATPNIDQLASEGAQFDYAVTTTGLCSPSRAAFFTGRWGHKTGLDDNIELWHSRLQELSPAQGGLIRRAVDAEYFVGYVGKWHLGAQGPALRGAEYVRGSADTRQRFVRFRTPYDRDADMKRYLRGERDENDEKIIYYETVEGAYEQTATAAKVRDAREMMRLAKADDRPFFGVVSFSQPHPPYHVPEPYASMFDPDDIALPANHNLERKHKPITQDGIYWPWHDVSHMTAFDWRKARAHYYGAVAMIDRAVGEILASASTLGLAEDLHIVLIGDQGSMLGEHQLFDKGPYAYDELMRIPLIIKDPGLAPQRIRQHVSLLDVTPTLAQWMGLKPDGDVDGQSLMPLMRHGDAAGDPTRDASLYAYEWYNGSWFGIRALRTHDYKYVWNASDARDELYDLKNDPSEIVNLIDESAHAPALNAMIDRLDAALAESADPSLERFRFQMSNRKGSKPQ